MSTETQGGDGDPGDAQPAVVERDNVSSAEEIALAKRRGWADKPDFHDAPEKWKPAKDWLSFGDNNNAILRKQLREVEQKLETVTGEAKQAMEYFRNLETTVKGKNLERLKEARKKAISDGDGDAYAAADDAIAELMAAPNETTVEPVKPAPLVKPEDLAAFRQKNQWVNDPVLGEIAYKAGIAIARQAQSDGETLDGPALLEKVVDKMRDLYPHKFAGRNARGGVVEGGGAGGGGRGDGRSFRDLPAEAQKQARKFLEAGVIKKGKDGVDPLEKYAKNYFALNQE